MALVPLLRTTFSTADFAEALHEADPDLSREARGVLWAQWALETGRGKACVNFNLGNVKVTQGQVSSGIDYVQLPGTWEMIAGKRVVFDPPHPQTWFRAFRSLAEGMTHHLGFLRTKRYAPAWPAVLSGDPETFARRLKALGYYTASADLYAAGLAHLHAEWMRIVPEPVLVPVEPNEVSIIPIHGRHVVDWALEQREADLMARLDAELGGFGRYEEEAA